MSGSSARKGESAGNAIMKGVGMIHGAGEAIRGNINAAVDAAAGDKQAAARQEQIASQGAREMDQGYHRHGTTGTHTGTQNTGIGAGNTGVGSTNYGPHDSNIGNKMDPRVDSDLDNRGTQTGSTNYGPHSTNIGNKLDPQYDSELAYDHGGASVEEGVVKWSLKNRGDLIINHPGADPTLKWQYGPPDNLQNSFTRRDTDPSSYGEKPPSLPPRKIVSGTQLSDKGQPQPRSARPSTNEPIQHIHRSGTLNWLDPRVDSTKLKRETGSRSGVKWS